MARGPLQRRARRRAVRQREDREDPREQHPGEAGGARPGAGRDPRLRGRAGRPGPRLSRRPLAFTADLPPGTRGDHDGGVDVRHLDQDGDPGPGRWSTSSGTAAGGFVWVDIPEWTEAAEYYLRERGCHEMVLEACRTRNHVPTVHGYADHVFITAQSPAARQGRARAPARARPGHRARLPGDRARPAEPGRRADEALVETESQSCGASSPVDSVRPRRTSSPSRSPRRWRAANAG